MATSIGVLYASVNSPIEDWSPIQPQVWMAVLSVISNALLAYAVIEGVAIRFWRKTLCGTTVWHHP
jgi:hypothetical protein